MKFFVGYGIRRGRISFGGGGIRYFTIRGSCATFSVEVGKVCDGGMCVFGLQFVFKVAAAEAAAQILERPFLVSIVKVKGCSGVGGCGRQK